MFRLGFTETANLLIQKGATVDHINDFGDTSLILASFKGNLKWFQLNQNKDLQIDSNFSIQVKKQQLDCCLQKEQMLTDRIKRVIRPYMWLLLLVNYSQKAVEQSFKQNVFALPGQEAIVSLLLQNGADRTKRNSNGKLAKDLAVEKGFVSNNSFRIINYFGLSNKYPQF